MFLDEVLSRVKEFLTSSQTEDVIRPSDSHTSLSRTLDLKLPLEGRGLDVALDDIEEVLRHSVRTTASWFHEPALGWPFHHFYRWRVGYCGDKHCDVHLRNCADCYIDRINDSQTYCRTSLNLVQAWYANDWWFEWKPLGHAMCSSSEVPNVESCGY